MKVALSSEPLSIDVALAEVAAPDAGGIDLFVGMVRDHNRGQSVARLEYQAYEPMAVAEMTRIAAEVEREFGARVAVHHRVGMLAVGEIAVICAASAAHRAEAFAACRALIDRVKKDVPIWKREHGSEGAIWLDGCAAPARDGLPGTAPARAGGSGDQPPGAVR